MDRMHQTLDQAYLLKMKQVLFGCQAWQHKKIKFGDDFPRGLRRDKADALFYWNF